jgi:hypothetical protein
MAIGDDRRPSIFETLTSSPLFLVSAILFVMPLGMIVVLFVENHPGQDRLIPALCSLGVAAVAGVVTVKKYKSTVKLCREGELATGRVREFGLAYRGLVNITYTYAAGQAVHQGRTSVSTSVVERLHVDPSIPVFFDPLRPGHHVIGKL